MLNFARGLRVCPWDRAGGQGRGRDARIGAVAQSWFDGSIATASGTPRANEMLWRRLRVNPAQPE